MTKFKDIPKTDQDILIAKAIHVIKHSKIGLMQALELANYGELSGLFEKVKFGHQAVHDEKMAPVSGCTTSE